MSLEDDYRKKVRLFRIKDTYGDLVSMRAEIKEMTSVLLGAKKPPIDAGVATLMEVANAYYTRGLAMQIALLRLEADGKALRGTRSQKFRTGELRSFLEMAKAATDLGSRRLTALQVEWEITGRTAGRSLAQ